MPDNKNRQALNETELESTAGGRIEKLKDDILVVLDDYDNDILATVENKYKGHNPNLINEGRLNMWEEAYSLDKKLNARNHSNSRYR